MKILQNISIRKKINVVFTSVFIILIISNTYEVLLLVGKIIHLFENIVALKVNLRHLNNSYVVASCDFYPTLLGRNSKEEIRGILEVLRKIPILLLYLFFILVALNFFISDNNFNLLYYVFVGAEHLLLHYLLHFFERHKQNEYYYLLSSINKVKRHFGRRRLL